MGIKLFAMEDDGDKSSSDNNELLIDKVLNKAKKDDVSPLNLTAQLIEDRQNIKKELESKLDGDDDEDKSSDNSDDNKEGDDSNDDSSDNDDTDSSGDDKDDSSDNKDGEDNSEDKDSGDNDGDKDKEDKPEKEDKKSDDEEDISGAASDKDDLNSIIGSDLGGSSDKEEKKEVKEAKESYREKPSVRAVNKTTKAVGVFTGIHLAHESYVSNLSKYGLEDQANKLESQNLVYVKESVIESLNKLVQLANNYIQANDTFINKCSVSAKSVNERVTVFKTFVDAGKYRFNHKLVNDKAILENISLPGKSAIRETVRGLVKYVEGVNNSILNLMKNDLSQLKDSFTTSNFKEEGYDLVYNEVVPGFNILRLHIEPYVNYLKTPIENYQYYKVRTFKPSDLFDLDSIDISDDKELAFIVSYMDKLLVSIATNTDNLRDINTGFTKFIDDVKVIIYDVEKDKQTNLSTLGIDQKVKDFIKFKLSIEANYININLVIDYLTGVMTVLNETVELKGQ